MKKYPGGLGVRFGSSAGVLGSQAQRKEGEAARPPYQSIGPGSWAGTGPGEGPGGGPHGPGGGQDVSTKELQDDEQSPDPVLPGSRTNNNAGSGSVIPMSADNQNSSANPTPKDFEDFLGGPTQCF